uniref:Sterol regulatory element-binding protein ECM22 n=1 Tax=Talaromyces marneffei PM1 TaxID=1077442 RepID=A0A093VQ83_TALMA
MQLQCPIHALHLLDDLHLFHHFTISTYNTISDDAGSRELWQIHVPRWGMNFPSIQHLILAISALHWHELPNRRDEYVQKADEHFTFGLWGPRVWEYLVFGDHGPSEWRVLMNGVRLVVESHHSEVFTGVLAPISQPTALCVGLSSDRAKMDSHIEPLRKVRTLVQQHMQRDTDMVMYDTVIDDLLAVMAEVNEKRSIQWPQTVNPRALDWVSTIPMSSLGNITKVHLLLLQLGNRVLNDKRIRHGQCWTFSKEYRYLSLYNSEE